MIHFPWRILHYSVYIYVLALQNLMRDVGRNLNKLVRELKTVESPEAMVYLRLLGNELGYLRTKDMEEMAYSAAMMMDSMFKMFPTDVRMLLVTFRIHKLTLKQSSSFEFNDLWVFVLATADEGIDDQG